MLEAPLLLPVGLIPPAQFFFKKINTSILRFVALDVDGKFYTI
jgi:hypothetical protein